MGFDLDAPFGSDIDLHTLSDVNLLGETSDADFLVQREELIQRLIRRLLTNPGEWIPFPAYGGGLRLKLHETMSVQLLNEIKSTVISQLLKEPDIAQAPLPQVEFSQSNGLLLVKIKCFTVNLDPVEFLVNPNLV